MDLKLAVPCNITKTLEREGLTRGTRQGKGGTDVKHLNIYKFLRLHLSEIKGKALI